VTFWHEDPEYLAGAAPGVFDLNIAIEQGSFIGLNGPSGSGKTTLSDLLVGLYSPKRGTITVAGEQLDGEVLERWRSSLSYVVQDPFLFHDTIRNNLLWAREESSEDELWSALALAGADEFVRATDAQLDTVVGERGSLLSGGERQRIALARAILRRPSLLVLDEATNAIDVRGEAEILDRLSRLSPRPTVLIIAHRASSLDFCDRVLELRNGRVIS
jgi:ABC-type multidrug transport system fused ATPase/permease subunit